MLQNLTELLQQKAANYLQDTQIAQGELTIEVAAEQLRELCVLLRDDEQFGFQQLIDIAGVDYVNYGLSEWQTSKATSSGFERAVNKTLLSTDLQWQKPRFAVVYHLLSITQNQRIRLRVFANGEPPLVPSVTDIFAAADWYEREVFDLYGIVFAGHPDLRRILTDYGFIGHPFRKDFPLIGHVQVRYDTTEQRVIYEPVTIQPRVLVPKVIREDNRYQAPEGVEHG